MDTSSTPYVKRTLPAIGSHSTQVNGRCAALDAHAFCACATHCVVLVTPRVRSSRNASKPCVTLCRNAHPLFLPVSPAQVKLSQGRSTRFDFLPLLVITIVCGAFNTEIQLYIGCVMRSKGKAGFTPVATGVAMARPGRFTSPSSYTSLPYHHTKLQPSCPCDVLSLGDATQHTMLPGLTQLNIRLYEGNNTAHCETPLQELETLWQIYEHRCVNKNLASPQCSFDCHHKH